MHNFLKQYNEALPHYKEVLKIYEKAYGENHPDIVKILNLIGKTHLSLGQTESAALKIERASSIERQISHESGPLISTLDWMECIEDIEGSQNTPVSQVSDLVDMPLDTQQIAKIFSTQENKIMYVKNIQYANPLLNLDLSKILTEAENLGTTKGKIINTLIELGNDREVAEIIVEATKEFGISHVLKVLFETPKIHNTITNIGQNEFCNSNILFIATFIIKESLESSASIEYFFNNILHIAVNLPQIIDNNYFKTTTHFIASNLAMYLYKGEVDALSSSYFTAIYGSRIITYNYLEQKKQQFSEANETKSIDNINEFLEKCGTDILAPIIFTSFGGIITPTFYDLGISAFVGGLQCYNFYNNQPKIQIPSSINVAISYALDLSTLYVAGQNLNLNINTLLGQMLTVKQCITAINTIVLVDHFAKLSISLIEENYFNNMVSFIGDKYDYFIE
jgi:tetratricopeptide (TPR) repeat protein